MTRTVVRRFSRPFRDQFARIPIPAGVRTRAFSISFFFVSSFLIRSSQMFVPVPSPHLRDYFSLLPPSPAPISSPSKPIPHVLISLTSPRALLCSFLSKLLFYARFFLAPCSASRPASWLAAHATSSCLCACTHPCAQTPSARVMSRDTHTHTHTLFLSLSWCVCVCVHLVAPRVCV